jgi:hypothetical protein
MAKSISILPRRDCPGASNVRSARLSTAAAKQAFLGTLLGQGASKLPACARCRNVKFASPVSIAQPPALVHTEDYRSRPLSTLCSAKKVPGNTRFCRWGDRYSERRRDTPVSGRGRHCFPYRQPRRDQFPLLYRIPDHHASSPDHRGCRQVAHNVRWR